MIEVRELVKSFGDIRALGGVDFTVREGEIFGLLGPNGAGKTTTISIIAGLLSADSGSVRVSGMDIRRDGRRVRRMLGVVPQDIALYEELSGRENLRFWGGLYGLSGKRLHDEADRVLELVGLTDRADDAVREYSGGMKRRLNLSAGLIHRPKVILLDEPTLGIDPQARLNILDIIRDGVSGGMTAIYTTHYLEEAEKLCDRIAIVDHGKILAQGTLKELVKLAGEGNIVTVSGAFSREQVNPLLKGVVVEHLENGSLRMLIPGQAELSGALGRLFSAGIPIGEVSIQEPSLEGVFIKLTGRELRD
ncbi:MAG: ABC transporter ATP-binding protein [Candidatus Krumholzibacteria bacterium]|nr:ABC transporter ATP-binding protein [Candidatus Krumholzibacteria bacterium]